MAGKLPRAIWRTTLVLLASGLVIAASWVFTPPYEARRFVAEDEQAAKTQIATPGSEAALRRVIGEIQQGRPNYARMSKGLADALRRQPEAQKRVAAFGPVQAVGFLGGGRTGLLPGHGQRIDRFRVTFRNGMLIWVIALGQDGEIDTLAFNTTDPPTPRQVMDGYASFSAGVRTFRWAEQFAIMLLAVPLLGRFVLRLRL